MKRIVASVGLVALGASGLQAATDSGLTSVSTKPWSVSATLRGFYDDNINSASSDNPLVASNGEKFHRSTFGFEVSPSILLSWPWEQTSINLGYIYSFKDYQFKPVGNTDTVDMTHTFNAALDHSFNQLWHAKVNDSFVIGQEPDFLRAGNMYATFARASGNNIRNYGNATLDGQLTPVLGFEVGYANALYKYANDNPAPSLAGLLDRLEHAVHLDSRWQLTPQTVGVVGYQFSETDFTGNETLIPGTAFNSESRNSRGQYGYVGADETFTPQLTGSLRVGARYTDYYNDPTVSGNVTPFVQLSLRWNYGVESYVEAGFVHDRMATDLIGNGSHGTLTLDSETSSVYGTVNHRLAPNLYVSLTGQYQDSAYNAGQFQSLTDNYYSFGADLQYRFSNYVSSDVGYNYDRLESEIAFRGFDRNRVYVGLTASY